MNPWVPLPPTERRAVPGLACACPNVHLANQLAAGVPECDRDATGEDGLCDTCRSINRIQLKERAA